MAPQRIPVTIAGSVPPVPARARLLEAAARGDADPALLETELAAATADAVTWQAANGVDIVSDGEVGRLSFMDARRLGGFAGPAVPFRPLDLDGAGEMYAADYFACTGDLVLPSNTGPVSYDPGPTDVRIARFRAALAGCPVTGSFLAAPSPGTITLAGTSYYRSQQEFLYAAAAALAQEYRAIAEAGITLQVDAPDLALPYHAHWAGISAEDFRARARMHAEVLNHALAGIDPARIRLHVCWGNYPGPHHRDIGLAAIIDILYLVRAGTLVLEGASPRHRADWRVLAARRPPEPLIVAAGVIDTKTPGVEAPEAVADALVQIAGITGRDRVIASSDCGFGTFAGAPVLPARAAELKVQALAAGAQMASRRLWRPAGAAA